ncbi:MAG: hypothetical protein ACI91Q_000415 [Gammaproteobacteria bacterium]|jgi:hypothetical protein
MMMLGCVIVVSAAVATALLLVFVQRLGATFRDQLNWQSHIECVDDVDLARLPKVQRLLVDHLPDERLISGDLLRTEGESDGGPSTVWAAVDDFAIGAHGVANPIRPRKSATRAVICRWRRCLRSPDVQFPLSALTVVISHRPSDER